MNQEVFDQLKKRADNASPIGGTLKFVVDDTIIFIDGRILGLVSLINIGAK